MSNLEKRIEAIKAICKSWMDNDTDYMDTGKVTEDFHNIFAICRNIELEDLGLPSRHYYDDEQVRA